MLGYLLLDPDMMDGRTSDSSDITDRRASFRARVVARDEHCVLTGAKACQACHIIPHAKGDQVRSQFLYHSESLSQAQYISNLVSYRDESLEPTMSDINDTRNGVLLSVALQPSFGASKAAFLQVSCSTQSSSA